jgi:hypothetical protein
MRRFRVGGHVDCSFSLAEQQNNEDEGRLMMMAPTGQWFPFAQARGN